MEKSKKNFKKTKKFQKKIPQKCKISVLNRFLSIVVIEEVMAMLLGIHRGIFNPPPKKEKKIQKTKEH